MLTVTEKDTCLNTTNEFMNVPIDEFEGFDLIIPMNVLKEIRNIKSVGIAYQKDLNTVIDNLFEDKFIQKQFDTYKDCFYKEVCEKKHIFVSFKDTENPTANDYKSAILANAIPFPENRTNALWNAFRYFAFFD